MTKVLTYIGDDSWSRQVYQDENGRLWKDTDNRRKWLGRLCSVVNNEFDGEPDCHMRADIECVFIPERIVRD